jgi:hypothetical protein
MWRRFPASLLQLYFWLPVMETILGARLPATYRTRELRRHFVISRLGATEVVNIANATVQIGSASREAMDNAFSSLLAGAERRMPK